MSKVSSHSLGACWLTVAFLLVGSAAIAQDEIDTVSSMTGIAIETAVDRAEIYVGDLIDYSVTITYDSVYELIPPPLGANLGAFDVKDYQSDIITRLPDGRIQSENKFVLSTFTTGDYVIPPLPAIFNLPDGSKKLLLSEGVPIKVKSLLAESADTLDVRPLKPPHEFRRDLSRYYLWGGVGLAVLVVAGILVWMRLRRRKGPEEPVDTRPPWEMAFERLALLEQENLLADRKYKEYYFELTEIARFFMGRMYEINTLDMTTTEYLQSFEKIRLPGDLYEASERFLVHADLVKFAKLVPENGRAESDFSFVHDMIESVRADFTHRQDVVVQHTVTDRVDESVTGGPPDE